MRLVRADLMLSGLLFSGDVDTDIVFEYGIFTPRCRSADLADLKPLDLRMNVPSVRGGDHVLPDWKSAWATLTAAARAIK